MKKLSSKLTDIKNRVLTKLSSANKLPIFTLSIILVGLIITIIAVQQQQIVMQDAAEICEDTSNTAKKNNVKINEDSPTDLATADFIKRTKGGKVEGHLVVRYKAGRSKNSVNEKIKKRKGKVKRRTDRVRIEVIEVPKGQEAETIAELAKDPNVEFVEQENYIYPGSIPNDPDFDEQWYLHNTGQTSGKVNADIDAPQAWDKTRGSNDVIIAVLDSGVDKNHPELRGKIVAEKSFVGGSAEDKHGHGTAMAGIAAARGNNNEGISGVCPECSLIIGKVIEPGVAGTDANLAEGIAWAVDNNADVISISVGSVMRSQILAAAVKEAVDKGIVVAAYGGNCGDQNFANNMCSEQNQTMYPAGFSGVIGVAATDHNDEKASFSNYGTNIDVAAPGDNIYTLLPNNGYSSRRGTSEATPMVAGLAGLLISQGSTGRQAINRIQNTADKIDGTGSYWTHGRINAAKAVGSTSQEPTNTQKPKKPTNTPKPAKDTKPTCRPEKDTKNDNKKNNRNERNNNKNNNRSNRNNNNRSKSINNNKEFYWEFRESIMCRMFPTSSQCSNKKK